MSLGAAGRPKSCRRVYRTLAITSPVPNAMKQQRCSRVVLAALLVFFSVSSCSASSFAEWMNAQKAGAVAGLKSEKGEYSDYSGTREYDEQCLKMVSFKNCRLAGGAFYSE